MQRIREAIEQRELETLSPFAAKAAQSVGRKVPVEPDPVRTCFQRDRDRILHSKPFRRLKHKTQVFIAPHGDHYRTRLTHSLEVAQIARTICRALLLNEDLAEAIALGHDVGHTPFGHAGESALNEALQAYKIDHPEVDLPSRFLHYEQSLRVLEVLSDLNLTYETISGIGGHSKGRGDLTAFDGQPTSTLEAAVVRISDRIAYLNHDLDDAFRSGIISAIPSEFASLGDSHSARIGKMVSDVIECSYGEPAIQISPVLLSLMNGLKEWLFDNVYQEYPSLNPDIDKARLLVKVLFAFYCQPGNLPEGFEGAQGALDYVAGMTDRFAIDTYASLTLPTGWKVI